MYELNEETKAMISGVVVSIILVEKLVIYSWI